MFEWGLASCSGTPSLREVRAGGWSELSPRCVGAAAQRAGLSPSLCDAPIWISPASVLSSAHTLIPLDQWNSEGFPRVPMDSGPESSDCHQLRERSHGPGGSILEKVFSWRYRTSPLPRSKTFMFLGVAGGTIERSCYSPHYVNTEGDYERDYQATLPQGRTAADGCKPRHGRDDRKRERSFSGLSAFLVLLQYKAQGSSD